MSNLNAAFASYADYMEKQCSILANFCIFNMGIEPADNGNYTVDGVTFMTENADGSLRFNHNMEPSENAWFAGFQKAANEWHKEREEAKQAKSRISREDLLQFLNDL